MEIEIDRIPYQADRCEVKSAIAAVLHSPEFFTEHVSKARPMNFEVKLVDSTVLGFQNNGVGTLSLPTHDIGRQFLRWANPRDGRGKITVRGRALRFYQRGKLPPSLRETLQKVPYIDPNVEEDHIRKVAELDTAIRIAAVQIGVFYVDPAARARAFSVEWEYDSIGGDPTWLGMHYDHRVIRIKFMDPIDSVAQRTLVVKLSSIQGMESGMETGKPYIIFDLHTPVIIETEDPYRTLSGDRQRDSKDFRHRLTSFDSDHALVAPYAHHLRIVLFNEDDLDEFDRFCDVVTIRRPVCPSLPTEASQRRFFSAMRLREVQCWIALVDWPVAFQIEALLHNGLVTTEVLLAQLRQPIMQAYDDDRTKCADLLRYFVEGLQAPARPPDESALECFLRVQQGKRAQVLTSMPPGIFSCRRVTFTPTRMLLEGPYAIQSNRVIRRYKEHPDHFICVDYRDEDRLQYRWDREVDGAPFLRDRVGGVLKGGFNLGGRHFKFEFLAYSSSALREHSVWFVRPFPNSKTYKEYHSADVHLIDAKEIRRTLGDFKGVDKQPAKFAARMAQAFTATDPSVRIRRDEWEEVEDLGLKPYEHTDGVGCISPDLASEIWQALCQAMPYLASRPIVPSAYQIRFLGYKGMVGVDERMTGRRMKLRPSMNKFSVHYQEEAEIEIARAFDKPMICMLNRPLIMILEDRGVHRDVFMKMQNEAKEETMFSTRDLSRYRSMLFNQGLGTSYRLAYIADNLLKLGFDLRSTKGAAGRNGNSSLEYGFFRRLGHYAIHATLREIKHSCRIPIKNGWLLPGIADEGPRYEADGAQNVYSLPPGEIYVCIQGPDDAQPRWLKGRCIIWRNPAVHPGDVQQVYAVGKPPAKTLCSFRNLKNVVVLPSTGPRSLASMLGGGDVDGDLFYITQEDSLFPTIHHEPAKYDAGLPFILPDGRTAEIDDVCDFVVKYIDSDVLGLLSSQHLVISDQSREGTLDRSCLELARLCGLAVDYPKSGMPIDISHLPRRLIPYPPDWSVAEVANIERTHAYESSRALGHLFRDFALPKREDLDKAMRGDECATFEDNVSRRLQSRIKRLAGKPGAMKDEPEWLLKIFCHYAAELRFICATHTLSNGAARLSEEEVVVGTILAQCSQRRWRKDRTQRMKTHSRVLVRAVELAILGAGDGIGAGTATRAQLRSGLGRAWNAWCYAARHRADEGAQSFGLIALGVMFACIEHMEEPGKVTPE